MITSQQQFDMMLQNIIDEMAARGQDPRTQNPMLSAMPPVDASPLPRQMQNDTGDPMTPAQMEASRRMVADARFQQGNVAQGMMEATGIPMMTRGAADVYEGATTGNPMLAAGGAGQMLLGTLPYGSGRLIGKAVPFAEKYGNWAAQRSGVSGWLAERVPGAAAIVGAVEGTKAATDAGRAFAQETMAPPPPEGISARAKQQFLKDQGYPIEVDGAWGGQSKSAMADYQKRFNEFDQRMNSPEALAVRNQERAAQAAAARANALRTEQDALTTAQNRENAERERRASLLGEADERYANRDQTWGQTATKWGQEMVGPAIMGASALLGAKGLVGAPAQRRTMQALDKRANKMLRAKALTDAERAAFVQTFDKTARGRPIAEGAGTVGAYGALGTEMYLASQYLDEARQEYAQAMQAFEQGQNTTDGGKERELADRVAKAKANVEKWENLQGAGLHGMGYLTAGKFGSMVTGKAKPDPNSLYARNRMAAELTAAQKGITNQKTGPLPPPPSSPPGGPPPQLPGQPPSPPPQGGPTPPGSGGTGGGGPQGGPGPNQPDPQGNRPGGGQGGPGSGRQSSSLTSSRKASIRSALDQNNGNLTLPQAQAMMANVPKDTVKKYLDQQKQIYQREGPAGYRRNMGDYLSIAPFAAAGVAAGMPVDDE